MLFGVKEDFEKDLEEETTVRHQAFSESISMIANEMDWKINRIE